MLTSFTKLFCPFPALGAYNPGDNNGSYNLTNNNKCKRNFDTTFLNSCLLADNHNEEEIGLSFAGYKYSNAVKLNRLWQYKSFRS